MEGKVEDALRTRGSFMPMNANGKLWRPFVTSTQIGRR